MATKEYARKNAQSTKVTASASCVSCELKTPSLTSFFDVLSCQHHLKTSSVIIWRRTMLYNVTL